LSGGDDRPRRGLRPARPLFGYRDIGEGDVRHSRQTMIRTWILVAILSAVSLAWMLIVYFLEPGLR
jgi:hypothetical protein